jgi:hypothetical protein
MTGIPIAGPRTEGRILGLDWSVANVAKLLRANSELGAWQSSRGSGRNLSAVNQHYIRKASAKHLPTGVSLIFMRLAEHNDWYASLCFAGDDHYLPWNEETAEQWLRALFGDDRLRVRTEDAGNPSVRQFILSRDPAAAAPQ